ncbi:substrate-binding periplasmic protein [Catenovulum maritimum]|nr:transporter substrate-binding domain-containing protein [Catenovulum maritimum]
MVNEPPANYINKQGIVDGFATDIVQAIQLEIGDNTKIEVMPEARALFTAEREPNILIYSFSRTRERENKFHWIQKVQIKNWSVFSLTENKLKITSLNDLKQLKSIAVVRGDIRTNWLKKQDFENLSLFTTAVQSLNSLYKKRVEAVVYEQQGINYLMETYNLNHLEIEKVYDINQSDVYIMMSKNGTNKDIVNKWKNAANNIYLNGIVEKISRRWSILLKSNSEDNYQVEINDGILML